LLSIVLLCFISMAHAQTDSCADVTRDTDTVSKIITLTSPDMKVMIKNVITNGIPELTLTFTTKAMEASDEAGLYIRLEDGKWLRYFGQHISRTWINSYEGYRYEATMPCNPVVLEKLKTKRITMFQIASIDVSIDDDLAGQFQGYVNCVSK
jgi:hypothetical protein